METNDMPTCIIHDDHKWIIKKRADKKTVKTREMGEWQTKRHCKYCDLVRIETENSMGAIIRTEYFTIPA